MIKIKGMDEKEYNGTVIDIDEIAIPSPNEGIPKVNARIRIDDADERIKMGYEAKVKIDFIIKEDAVVVDFQSIVQDLDGKKYIYFVENNIAKRKAVKTGVVSGFEVEITEGI